MTAEERLVELGQYVRMGGASNSYAGAKLFERMLEGSGSSAGAGMPKFVSVGATFMHGRIAETVRAVSALGEVDQATVMTCYIEPLPHRAQQAAALGIKPNMLRERLRAIRQRIGDWLRVKDAARSEKFFREPAKIIS